ncbi:MAG: hypothetical protein ACXWT7_05490 [Methylophilaceae bacterium]
MTNSTLLLKFFWDNNYPARSFTRIFVLMSISVYVWGRYVEPGPIWAREIIEMLVYTFNLEFIQKIALIAPQNLTFWRGTGFALQMQLLFTWPVLWLFAISTGWLCRNGSKDFEKYPPIIKQPTLKNWLTNLLLVVMILFLAYYPFNGSNIFSVHKSTGPFTVIQFDTFFTSIFWMFAGWIVIYFTMGMFYIIKTELTLTLNRGK